MINYTQNTTQKTKLFEPHYKPGLNSDIPELYSVHAPLVVLVQLFSLQR